MQEMPVKKLFYVLMFFCQIFIFFFLLAHLFDRRTKEQKRVGDACEKTFLCSCVLLSNLYFHLSVCTVFV